MKLHFMGSIFQSFPRISLNASRALGTRKFPLTPPPCLDTLVLKVGIIRDFRIAESITLS